MLGPDGSIISCMSEHIAAVHKINATLSYLDTITTVSNFDATISEAISMGCFSKKIEKKLAELNMRPFYLERQFTLYPHQKRVFEFMWQREHENQCGITGGLLNLDTGLGKSLTVVSYSLLAQRPHHPKENNKVGYPTLIVCPKSIIKEWKEHVFEKFFGDRLKVLYIHSEFTPKDRIKTLNRKAIVSFDFVVTNYDTISRRFSNNFGRNYKKEASRANFNDANKTGLDILFYTPWERVICDESQNISNVKSIRYKGMQCVYGKYKWCLSGTPIKNSDQDLKAQLQFLGYTLDLEDKWNPRAIFERNLTKCVLRMSYTDAGIYLPSKQILDHNVAMTPQENKCYDALAITAKHVLATEEAYCKTLALIIAMRQCCISPFLLANKLKGAEDILQVLKDYNISKKWLENEKSSKITKIIDIISAIPKTEKYLIFTSFATAANLISTILTKENHTNVLITGKTPNRNDVLQSFRKNNNIKGLVITCFIGSEGLNITEANHVVFADFWWTYASFKQGYSRAWRMGQTKPVTVHAVMMRDSIETRIRELCNRKRDYGDAILEGKKQDAFKLTKQMAKKLLSDDFSVEHDSGSF